METIDFNNKTVSFGTVSGENLAIKNPNFQTIHNRLFIVGVVSKSTTTNDWAAGKVSAVAWDTVTDYIVFESEEQYINLIDKS